MGWLRRLGSIGIVAAKRLLNNRGLALGIITGLSIAVALAVGIPVYSDAVNTRMLSQELMEEGRPPFSVMYWYLGSNNGALDIEDIQAVDTYIRDLSPRLVDLPLILSVRHIATDYMRMFATDQLIYPEIDQPLDWPSLGFISGVEEQITIVEGRPARVDPEGDSLEAVILLDTAERLGLQAGETFVLVGETEDQEGGEKRQLQFKVHLTGIWVPRDPTSPYWFYRPRAFDKLLLIPEDTYFRRVAPSYTREVNKTIWYHVFEGAQVRIQDVPRLLSAMTTIEQRIASALKGTSIALSPVEAMRKYRRQAYDLVILLYVFSIPVLGLVLYFVTLVSAMVVDRQRNEIALLRSRGTSQMQVFGIYVLEGVFVGAISVVVGLLGGRLLASTMGNASSFLTFTRGRNLETELSSLSLFLALLAIVLALLASLVPALLASRHTIVTYKRERARSHRRPAWERFYLDFALLLPVAYGYYVLARRGTISLLGGGEVVGDPFNNPILFLVPTLYILAGALIFLRVFPSIMASLARASERLRGASLLLALRSLARSLRDYSGPLMLLVLTVGLATFTVSMARTLDSHLADESYYATGGDFRLRERGELVGGDEEAPAESGAPASAPETAEAEEEHWEFLPAFDYLNVPGVEAVTRVADYRARVPWAPEIDGARMGGVDSDTLLDVVRCRSDFAAHTARDLMRTLFMEPAALLVERSFFRANKLKVGDTTTLGVYMLGDWVQIDFVVAGTVEYFPGFYPEDGPFFVANLAYLFSQAGGMYSYDLWIDTTDNMDTALLEQGIISSRLTAIVERSAVEEIAEERARPERQGFFGLLSVGFFAAATITALGFLIYSLVSFQRRSIELGVLRSIGLSAHQLTAYVVGEQLALVVVGVVFGTILGMSSGALFVPFLQVGSGEHAQTPPFVVQVPWSDVALILTIFGSMLVIVIAITVRLLRRMEIFQAVKMEEVE